MELRGHGGSIHCVGWRKGEQEQGLIITGSADRTVRVWDPWAREGKAAVQTLVGHGGTVLAVVITKGSIVSASTDHQVIVWKSDKERQLLFYPWFVVAQTICDFDNAFITSLAVNEGEAGYLFVGDSRGVLSVYSPETAMKPSKIVIDSVDFEAEYRVCRPQHQLHTLGIHCLRFVSIMNALITASFDHIVKVSDATSGSILYLIENPNCCRFTNFQWDTSTQDLFLVDELGYVQVWNVYAEKCKKSIRVQEDALIRCSY